MQTTNTVVSDTNKGQKYLGQKGLIVLIALLSAFVPMSTDIYLPSLPGMAKYFNVSVNLINLTLILFMVFFGLGNLLWGPLSDRYGRKPVLLAGLALYIIASLLCARAVDVYQLITFRVFQAVGGGAASAVAMAVVKDVYEGRKRESVMAVVQSMVLIVPAVAPVLGGVLLKFTSWRGVFWTLAGIGLLALAGGIALEETIDKHYTGTILQTMGRLGAVLKNPGFTSLLIVFSLKSIPLMAFIAVSSYIYVNGFRLSAQVYSYYFAINAAGLISGPMLYLYLSRQFDRKSIITVCFTMVAISGLLVCGLGSLKPWLFAVTLLLSAIAGSCLSTPSTILMLEQQQGDTGSASSLIGCFGILIGSMGMLLIAFSWSNIILALGTLNIITGLVCGALWLVISKKPYIKQVPNKVLK
jgi:DHA1 family bicyclomycin/chloramphenicol resistance-like MFS transporter